MKRSSRYIALDNYRTGRQKVPATTAVTIRTKNDFVQRSNLFYYKKRFSDASGSIESEWNGKYVLNCETHTKKMSTRNPCTYTNANNIGVSGEVIELSKLIGLLCWVIHMCYKWRTMCYFSNWNISFFRFPTFVVLSAFLQTSSIYRYNFRYLFSIISHLCHCLWMYLWIVNEYIDQLLPWQKKMLRVKWN